MDKQISAKLYGQSHSELIFTPILKDKNEIIQIKRKISAFSIINDRYDQFGGLDKTPLIRGYSSDFYLICIGFFVRKNSAVVW